MAAEFGDHHRACGDTHIVDPGAAAARDLARGCHQPVAELAGADKGDRALGRDRPFIVGVAGKGEGGIGQREDEAAMGDLVAVDHVRLDGHRERRLARFDLDDLDAKALARLILLPHRVRAGAGEIVGRKLRRDIHCGFPAVRRSCKASSPDWACWNKPLELVMFGLVMMPSRHGVNDSTGRPIPSEIPPVCPTSNRSRLRENQTLSIGSNLVLLAGLAIGLVYGAVGLLSGFCLMSSLRGWWAEGDGRLVRTYALAMGIAIVATQLLAVGGLVDLGRSIYLQASFSAPVMFLGGLMFGYGMVLSNGCGSRALVLLGRGNLRSLVVVIVLGIAAQMTLKGLIAPLRIILLQATQTSAKTNSLPALLSAPGLAESPARLLAASMLSAALLVFAFAHLPFRRAPGQIAAGLTVGLLVAAGWFATGY